MATWLLVYLSESFRVEWVGEFYFALGWLVLVLSVSKDDLPALYARRWNVELDLRNLKTTTGWTC